MNPIKLGYSPCPNDTYIFYALVHDKLNNGLNVRETLADIETLNKMAVSKELDVTKISFHAFAYLRNDYCLLHAGGALGRGCGPLLIAKKQVDIDTLHDFRVAIPGEMTTAALLLRLCNNSVKDFVVLPFNKIIEAVDRGEFYAEIFVKPTRTINYITLTFVATRTGVAFTEVAS